MATRLLVAGIGIPLMLILFLFCPTICVAIVLGVLTTIGAYELLKATGCVNHRVMIAAAMLTAFAVPFWYYAGCSMPAALGGLLLLMIALMDTAFKSQGKVSLHEISTSVMAGAVIPLMLCSLLLLCDLMPHNIYTMLPFFAAFGSDSAALFAGKFLGKHKLAPVLSPNKTVEGAIGGIFGAAALCSLYALIVQLATGIQPNYLAMVVFGLLGSVVSQFGDLAFSYIKRLYSIKDYGHLFLAHGGVLDRFDSVIFCAPFAVAFIQTIPLFQL